MESFFSVYILPFVVNFDLAAAILFIGRKISNVLLGWFDKLMQKREMDSTLINFVHSILKILFLLLIVIASLRQLGVDTTSLIALIGAAGLAVGLALKDTLQNFASGVLLIVFRPFDEGDFVEAGGVAGVIERIGMFATIFKSGDNREMIVPNSAIYSGTIINNSAKETRRIDLVFGIGYDDDLLAAKEILNEIINDDERILKDPAPSVAVAELADASVNFNVRPWVASGDYWPVRADIIEKVKLSFDEKGISIPYPQMDVHIHKTAE